MKNIFLLFLLGFYSCTSKNKDWQIHIPDITSASSPKATDLTGDGIFDIVMGAGGEEWNTTERGIIAINGANGELLWQAPARNQIVGTAVFLDINKDGTDDVIIGGRSAELQALDGKTGKNIWEFYSKKGKMISRSDGWYNFYNPQFVPDQDADGIKEILICNGGDAVIPAGMKYRPPGKLMLICSKTGKILAEDFMPDGQETYFSPVLMNTASSNPEILFGSGGESKPGHLYLTNLSDLKNKNLKNAKVLDSTSAKGYEAPPIIADFNLDQTGDILFSTVEGSTKLLDGKTHALLWSISVDSAEVFSQPAVGFFYGNDNIPDVFVQFAIGAYPLYLYTKQILIDGKTGKIVKVYHGKRFTYSSPLVTDLDNNGWDEVILNMVKDSLVSGKEKPFFELTVFDFQKSNLSFLGDRQNGACFASTPWIGDLDGDNKLDVVYSGSPATISEFPGSTIFEKPSKYLSIYRREFENIRSDQVKWGSYMGYKAQSHWPQSHF